jgi:hypothetical protein
MLDRAGGVLVDRSATEDVVGVPVGTHRLVLVGEGTIGSDAGVARLPGWHVATTVAQVNADVYLAPRSVITATASGTRRHRAPALTALARAGDAVAGHGTVRTRLPGDLRSVAVALEVEGAIDALLDGLVLGVAGAARSGEGLTVVAGTRAYAVFPLTPAENPSPITVTIGSDDRWLLAGLVGSPASANELADSLSDSGIGPLTGGLVADPFGSSQVGWRH